MRFLNMLVSTTRLVLNMYLPLRFLPLTATWLPASSAVLPRHEDEWLDGVACMAALIQSQRKLCVLQRKLPVSNNVLLLDPSGTFSNVPFFRGHVSAEESNKHSFMNSPSQNTLLFLGQFCVEIQNFTDESLFGCDTFLFKVRDGFTV